MAGCGWYKPSPKMVKPCSTQLFHLEAAGGPVEALQSPRPRSAGISEVALPQKKSGKKTYAELVYNAL